LLKLLGGKDKDLFQTFSDAQGKLSSVSISDGFFEGFCVGMKIAVEVMTK
jgi:hypothetical protein